MTVKPCKACQHSRRDWVTWSGERFRKCVRTDNLTVRRSRFSATPMFCEIERDDFFLDIGSCGASARYFAPWPSRVHKWLANLGLLKYFKAKGLIS